MGSNEGTNRIRDNEDHWLKTTILSCLPSYIYLFKVNIRNIRKGQEICSKLTKRKQQNDVIDAILIFYC